jgi:hypothetical protein
VPCFRSSSPKPHLCFALINWRLVFLSDWAGPFDPREDPLSSGLSEGHSDASG